MKTDNKLLALLGVAFITANFTTSCINSIPDEELASSEQIQVRIVSPIERFLPLSRMTGTGFENNDSIGVYLVNQPENLLGERHLDNIRFICTAGEFTASSPVYYPYGGSKCDFYSYYPYRKDAIAAGESTLPVTVKADQSLLSDYLASDFLAAFEPEVTPSKAKVRLSHYHKMCKLELEIIVKGSEDINALIESKPIATLLGLYTSGRYDFVKDTVNSLAIPQDISLYGKWVAKGDTLVGKSAILIPQTVSQGSKLLKFQVGERNFSAILPSSFLFQGGKICKLRLAYDSKIEIKKMDVIVEPWNAGQEMDMDAVEDGDNGFLSISESDFSGTSVLDIICQGKVIAVVCKEYLRSKDLVDATAIVAYPVVADTINLKQGFVMRLIGKTGKEHGGSVSLDKGTNSLAYTPGNSPEYSGLYITGEQTVSFEKPESFLPATVSKRYLRDRRGDEQIYYPMVKIGAQCWMQTNLCARKYTNGSTIPLLDKATTTQGYRVRGSEVYYNLKAVDSEDLAPMGWRISTVSDWNRMLVYLGNSTQTLKSKSLWKDATNLSGFDCKLIGYYSADPKLGVSFYTYGDKYTAYWGVDNDKIQVVYIKDTSSEVGFMEIHALYGLSVRCVSDMLR